MMLTPQKERMNVEFPQTVNFTLPKSLEASPYKRKTIVLQPPPELLAQTKNFTLEPMATNLLSFKETGYLMFKAQKNETILSDLTVTKESDSDKSELSLSSPDSMRISARSRRITKKASASKQSQEKGKKIYEISRFFVKNYVGALKSTINNPHCEGDILEFLGCNRDHIDIIKKELEKLLKENPKHNRMQLYKLIVNPLLNPIFQYFLRRKVVSWIFTSSKMQDKHAHLMARKNFLHLCVKAKELTPFNFKIALNFK